MFWISAGIFISATVLFWLFGSAETQPWNDLSRYEPTSLPVEEKQMSNLSDNALQTEDEEGENERL